MVRTLPEGDTTAGQVLPGGARQHHADRRGRERQSLGRAEIHPRGGGQLSRRLRSLPDAYNDLLRRGRAPPDVLSRRTAPCRQARAGSRDRARAHGRSRPDHRTDARLTVETPTRTDPPYVPIRHTRWPTQRTPRWLLLAGLAVLVGAVLVSLVHRPSQAQRAGDVRQFLTDMNTDIESCAGGVRESLAALYAIKPGTGSTAQDTQDTIKIAQYGASNCLPANNELLDDLTQYQVTESLAGFHLDNAVTGLLTWAFPDAQRV